MCIVSQSCASSWGSIAVNLINGDWCSVRRRKCSTVPCDILICTPFQRCVQLHCSHTRVYIQQTWQRLQSVMLPRPLTDANALL